MWVVDIGYDLAVGRHNQKLVDQERDVSALRGAYHPGTFAGWDPEPAVVVVISRAHHDLIVRRIEDAGELRLPTTDDEHGGECYEATT
jgi:hypothetical protein